MIGNTIPHTHCIVKHYIFSCYNIGSRIQARAKYTVFVSHNVGSLWSSSMIYCVGFRHEEPSNMLTSPFTFQDTFDILTYTVSDTIR